MCKYCEPFDEYGTCHDIIGETYIDATDRFHLSNGSGVFRIESYAEQSAPIKFCPMCGRNLEEKENEQ